MSFLNRKPKIVNRKLFNFPTSPSPLSSPRRVEEFFQTAISNVVKMLFRRGDNQFWGPGK
jgi:hypothetical protein